jgi:flagellar hook-associated protein 3 FlgL
MRVTNRMIFDAAQAQTASARERVEEASRRVADGQRVVHPGDDPAAAGIIVSHRVALGRYEAIDRAVARASEEAQVADGAMQGVSTLVARARELATQLGNDSYSASERASGAQEIRSISGQIVQLMNTTVAGRYIFGGNVDRTPPFDAAGNYSGDTVTRQVEVAPGLLENASVRADQALKGVGGGVDLFATLDALANALASNDGASVRGSLTALGSSGDQVATALTNLGGIMSSFDSARSIGAVAKDSVQKVLASESEVDIFEAATQLAAAQQTLEASLALAAKSFNVSLLDYL